ncbi:hypothetical protein [Chryseobacterium sp. 22543]|uniref:hypothetical protein n=1 Tax=Chryseobacterium sp. 22543 TaxID=3453940 RepID=UPI003F82D8B1
MNWLKKSILVIPALVGLLYAYAEANRATFKYVHICGSSVYTKIAVYDPNNCIPPDPQYCVYTSPVDVGATATAATLEAVGAQPGPQKRCYVMPAFK